MAINFEAANMAGYNNPKISILSIEKSGAGELSKYPSFDDVERVLSNGTIPVLVLRDINLDSLAIYYLVAIDPPSPEEPEFVAFASATGGNKIGTIAFIRGADPPVID